MLGKYDNEGSDIEILNIERFNAARLCPKARIYCSGYIMIVSSMNLRKTSYIPGIQSIITSLTPCISFATTARLHLEDNLPRENDLANESSIRLGVGSRDAIFLNIEEDEIHWFISPRERSDENTSIVGCDPKKLVQKAS